MDEKNQVDNPQQTRTITAKPVIKRFWTRRVAFGLGLILTLIIILGVIYGFTVNAQNEKKAQEKEEQKQKETSSQESQNEGYKYKDPVMTEEQLQKANLALKNGASIDDPENDFAVPTDGTDAIGRPDNKKGYPLGWDDIKKVTFGADSENFYVRIDLYGILPEKMVTVDGDDIKGLSCNVDITKYTTKSGQTGEGLWQVGISYVEAKGKEGAGWATEYNEIAPRIAVSNFASPTTNKDKYGESVYDIQSDKGAVSGGPGKDYIVAAFSLALLDILPDSDISMNIGVETNSEIYHHSSIDPLLDFGSAKSGKIINYTLGSNTYTTTVPDYK